MPLALLLLGIVIICCFFFWDIVIFWIITGIIGLLILAAKDRRGFVGSIVCDDFWDNLKVVCLGPVALAIAIFSDKEKRG